MIRREPRPISEVLQDMINRTGMQSDLTRHNAQDLWHKIVGTSISAYTRKVALKERTLHVYIASASLKEQLSYATESIRSQINNAIGEDAIDTISIH